jgi:hypothetical protein
MTPSYQTVPPALIHMQLGIVLFDAWCLKKRSGKRNKPLINSTTFKRVLNTNIGCLRNVPHSVMFPCLLISGNWNETLLCNVGCTADVSEICTISLYILFYFIYCLFNNAFNSSYHIASNDRVISERWFGKMWKERVVAFSIATGYRVVGRGSIPGRGKIFFILHIVHTGSGTHPASYPMSTVEGVKRPASAADHSPPSGAKVKNGKAISPLPYASSCHCSNFIFCRLHSWLHLTYYSGIGMGKTTEYPSQDSRSVGRYMSVGCPQTRLDV